MSFDEKLAGRINAILKNKKGMSSKRMFGGLCFLHNGNMCFGIQENRLMLRVGTERYEQLLKQKHVRPMDFTGRPLKGMVYVDPAGLRHGNSLKKWIKLALDFTSTLPAK